MMGPARGGAPRSRRRQKTDPHARAPRDPTAPREAPASRGRAASRSAPEPPRPCAARRSRAIATSRARGVVQRCPARPHQQSLGGRAAISSIRSLSAPSSSDCTRMVASTPVDFEVGSEVVNAERPIKFGKSGGEPGIVHATGVPKSAGGRRRPSRPTSQHKDAGHFDIEATQCRAELRRVPLLIHRLSDKRRPGGVD